MSRQLTVVGVSTANTTIDTRECLSITPSAAGGLLQSARVDGLLESLVVSTCNRTEFYLVGARGTDVATPWLEHVAARLARVHGYRWPFVATDADAARHLFRVACGLESTVLGDSNIGQQLKQWFATAAMAGTAGPMLSRTFLEAYRVSGAVRSGTALTRGHGSLGSAVASLVRTRHADGAHVLVIGAGVAARDVARKVAKGRCRSLRILNRTAGAAASLAAYAGGTAAPWASLDECLAGADVVVTAVSVERPVLDRRRLEACLARRQGRTMTVVDLGVPRNVEAIDGIEYIDIDHVAALTGHAAAMRRDAVPEAEALVDDAVMRWARWCWAAPGEMALRRLFVQEDRVRHDLVEAIVAAGYSGERARLEQLVKRAWRPMLRTHARELRSWVHGLNGSWYGSDVWGGEAAGASPAGGL